MAGSMTMAMMAVGAGASMMAEKQSQKKIAKQNRQYYDQQMSVLNRQRDAAVREQEERLKRTTATHRARMAASGISPDEGSSGALLDGLRSITQKNIDDREANYQGSVSKLEDKTSSATDKSIAPTTEASSKDHLGGANSILTALQGWD